MDMKIATLLLLCLSLLVIVNGRKWRKANGSYQRGMGVGKRGPALPACKEFFAAYEKAWQNCKEEADSEICERGDEVCEFNRMMEVKKTMTEVPSEECLEQIITFFELEEEDPQDDGQPDDGMQDARVVESE